MGLLRQLPLFLLASNSCLIAPRCGAAQDDALHSSSSSFHHASLASSAATNCNAGSVASGGSCRRHSSNVPRMFRITEWLSRYATSVCSAPSPSVVGAERAGSLFASSGLHTHTARLRRYSNPKRHNPRWGARAECIPAKRRCKERIRLSWTLRTQ